VCFDRTPRDLCNSALRCLRSIIGTCDLPATKTSAITGVLSHSQPSYCTCHLARHWAPYGPDGRPTRLHIQSRSTRLTMAETNASPPTWEPATARRSRPPAPEQIIQRNSGGRPPRLPGCVGGPSDDPLHPLAFCNQHISATARAAPPAAPLLFIQNS